MLNRTSPMKCISALVVCYLAVGLSCQAQAGQADEQRLYRMAMEHIGEYPADQQAYVKAKGLIRQLGAINQKSPLTYVAAGRLIYESAYIGGHEIEPEALRRARNLFSMAMRLDPRFLDAYIYTTYVCLFENKIAEARIIAQQAANIAQDSAQVAMLYGQIAMSENNVQEVEERAIAVLRDSRDKMLIRQSHIMLRWVFENRERYDLAEKEYQILIQLQPTSPWPKSGYSQFLTEHGRYVEAIDQAQQALAIMNYGMAHLALGEAHYWRGVELLWTHKQHQKAEPHFEKAILHDPTNANAHYGLGSVYLFYGYDHRNLAELRMAEKEYLKTIEMKPDHEQARGSLQQVRQYLEAFRK